MHNNDEEDSSCGACDCCIQCRIFEVGDRVELSVLGIIEMGRKLINRGTVKGQCKRKNIVILVHWDGYPEKIIGHINPKLIQKMNGEQRDIF